jgi:hypothetical protein
MENQDPFSSHDLDMNSFYGFLVHKDQAECRLGLHFCSPFELLTNMRNTTGYVPIVSHD